MQFVSTMNSESDSSDNELEAASVSSRFSTSLRTEMIATIHRLERRTVIQRTLIRDLETRTGKLPIKYY